MMTEVVKNMTQKNQNCTWQLGIGVNPKTRYYYCRGENPLNPVHRIRNGSHSSILFMNALCPCVMFCVRMNLHKTEQFSWYPEGNSKTLVQYLSDTM